MGWRDEMTTALNEWIALQEGGGRGERWQRIGAARATAKPGVFVADIRLLPATALISPPTMTGVDLNPFGVHLAEVLSRHVEISALDGERSFYEIFATRLAEARASKSSSSTSAWSCWAASIRCPRVGPARSC